AGARRGQRSGGGARTGRHEGAAGPCRAQRGPLSLAPTPCHHRVAPMPPQITTSSSHAVTFRLRLRNQAGVLARATEAIGRLGGNISTIDITEVEAGALVRDITVHTADDEHVKRLADEL